MPNPSTHTPDAEEVIVTADNKQLTNYLRFVVTKDGDQTPRLQQIVIDPKTNEPVWQNVPLIEI